MMKFYRSAVRFLLTWCCLYPLASLLQILAEESTLDEGPKEEVKDQTLQEHTFKEDDWDLLRPNPEAVANITWDIDWTVDNETNSSMDFFHVEMGIDFSVPYDFFVLYSENFREKFFPIWKENFLAEVKNLETFFTDYSHSNSPKVNKEKRIWRPVTHQDMNQGTYFVSVWLPHEAWAIFDENFHQFESKILDYNIYFLENTQRVVKAMLAGDKKEINDPHERMWALWNEGHEGQGLVKTFEKKSNLRTLTFVHGTKDFFTTHYNPKKYNYYNTYVHEYIKFSHTLVYEEYETTKLLMEEYKNIWEEFNSQILVRLKRLLNKLEKKAGIDIKRTETRLYSIDTTTVNWKMKRGHSKASLKLEVPIKILTHFGDEFSPEYKSILEDLENFYQNSPLEIDHE